MKAIVVLKSMFYILFIVFICSCADDRKVQDKQEPIGTALMKKDGTIVLKLRAQSGNDVGEAAFEYAPDDPEYSNIKNHIGDLKEGEEKFVFPWPSDGKK